MEDIKNEWLAERKREKLKNIQGGRKKLFIGMNEKKNHSKYGYESVQMHCKIIFRRSLDASYFSQNPSNSFS
jgi:hypothetical protein